MALTDQIRQNVSNELLILVFWCSSNANFDIWP